MLQIIPCELIVLLATELLELANRHLVSYLTVFHTSATWMKLWRKWKHTVRGCKRCYRDNSRKFREMLWINSASSFLSRVIFTVFIWMFWTYFPSFSLIHFEQMFSFFLSYLYLQSVTQLYIFIVFQLVISVIVVLCCCARTSFSLCVVCSQMDFIVQL